MKLISQWNTLLYVTILLFLCTGCAWSASDFSSVASDGILPFIAIGELSLLQDNNHGKSEAIQGAKALFATGIATEALKQTVHEKRPTTDSTDSFPSAHTAEAFAMATTLADYQPQYTFIAYTGAAIIGWSRVEEREHRWRDVLAGALLGHYIAKQFTGKHFGVTPEGIGYHTSW
ncbi:phosphatase PAP2 family protein [bacterium]|nr:phosphatase PAP2 family protein [bacterium]